MKRLHYYLLTLISLCVLSACKKDKITQAQVDYQKFDNYITKYPQGPVSRCGNIAINLGFEVEMESLPVGLIEVEPPISGQFLLQNSGRQIVIQDPQLKHNVNYTVKFNIGQLTEMPQGLETFTFPLEAKRQTLDIKMEPPINFSMTSVQYSGEVVYADCEQDRSIIEACLSAEQKGKPLKISWDHNRSKTRSKFSITDIKRGESPSTVDLTLDMTPLNVEDQSKMKLAVPSQSDFSLHGILQDRGPQEIHLIFTDPLLADQNLAGLINVEGREIQQLKVMQNKVIVFFKKADYGYFDVEILPGIKNVAGHGLKDTYLKKVFVTPPKPSVAIAEEGNILPPDDQWELPVRLITATGFRLRVLQVYDQNVNRLYQENSSVFESQRGLENLGRMALDSTFSLDVDTPFFESYHSLVLDKLIKRESGALYKILLTIPRDYIAFPCDSLVGETRPDAVDQIDFDRPWVSMGYDYDYYYGSSGNTGRTNFSESTNTVYNPCYANAADIIHDSRLLMCTDIGVVAKWEPESQRHFFYTSRITDATPMSNVQIKLYNFQGREVSSGYTNGQGMTTIAMGDDKPYMMKATSGNDVTYMELQDAKTLSMSTFQVEGTKWANGRRVYFYGDRDVWRPGDSIYMNAMVYNPDEGLPPNLPVNLKLYDPTNKVVKTWIQKSNADGIYQCHFETNQEAPTGKWRLEMSLGGQVYKTPVRVETIRPNRLKMSMAFSDMELIKMEGSLQAPISVKWMHGLEAKDLRTEVNLYQKALKNPFNSNYKNYVFDDIQKRYQNDLGIVLNANSDRDGLIDFIIPTGDNRTYPSMMLFNFELRAFEKGGAFSTDMKSIRYSPYSHYVGAKFPQGKNGAEFYVKDDEAIILTSLNQDGEAVERTLKVTLSEIEHNWWYQFGNQGNYSALSSNITKVKSTYNVKVGKEGEAISIKEYGRLLLTIEDEKSGHRISRVIYSHGGRWNDDSQEVSQLEVLPFFIEQTDYSVGDNLSFDLPPVPGGQYLITVESGGKIIQKEVRKGSTTPAQVNYAITSEMSPTAYVHVHLIQAWDTHINDRPLRLFGVKPINVFDPSTILEPEITMPDGLETDKNFKVKISEAEGKPMSYTLAIVDEGLLDLTQFRTPNPWSAFFGKEGLQVKTWDMYRYIFKRFLGEYTSLLAVGGDGSNAINASSKARRFKPVVKFLGPFTLSAGEEASHDITINNYVGSVRAMVVATNSRAIGNTDKTVPVKKPLMLYSTLPRVLGPQENIKVPVTVFSMDKSIKTVTATITTDDLVTVVGSKTQEVTFEKEGEQDITFDIETAEAVGVTTVDVEVKSGSHYFKETIELDLRPSAPVMTKSYSNVIDANSQQTINYNPIGMAGTQSGEVTVSKGLNFSFAPQVDWLSRYPHGCLEQSISRVFPQIYLYKMELLDDVDEMKYRQQYAAVIQKLRFLQLPNGGFAYWPGGQQANEWGTTYAMLFLLEAKAYGYQVPDDMLDRCKQYLYKAANNPTQPMRAMNNRYSDTRTISQAYRLYALAEAGKPNYSAMNRLRLVPQLHNTAKWLLAHAFVVIGEDELAKVVIETATQTTEDYRELAGSFGSSIRDQAIIARVLTATGQKTDAKLIIDEMVDQLNGKNNYLYSTQDRAQAMMTFAEFVGDLDKTEDTLMYSIQLATDNLLKDQRIDVTPHNYQLDESMLSSSIEVTNQSQSDLYTTVVMTGQPLRDDSRESSSQLNMDVTYYNTDGETINPKTIKKGEDFKVSYTVVHPGTRMDYENMALTAILPSGWEILNQRMSANSTFDQGSAVDYKDVRDDRVMLYFDLAKGKSKQFNLMCNATYEGKYWAPAVFCEAMYDASINAKSQGFWTTVK